MGCKWVNPPSPRLSLITRPDSCWRLEFVVPWVWECSGPGPWVKLSPVPFPTSRCSLVSILPYQHCSGLKQSCQQILHPQQIIEAGWWIQGLCCRVVFTDSSCLCPIVLPAAHSCVSSHELLCRMGQAFGIHNNILWEEVFHPHGLCVFLLSAGKGLIPIYKHRGWGKGGGL